MRNTIIVICVIALVLLGFLFFPRGGKDTTPETKILPPQTTKPQLKGRTIECEMKKYTDDGRIGITVHYVTQDANSTIVNVFFKNISEKRQPINLKDVYLEDRAKNILPLKRYKITWHTSNILDTEIHFLDPGEGVRVDYYFKKTEKLLRYFAFRNIYYENFEYTIWKVKIIY